MENQDKLYRQFKDAAGKAESKGYDRMEAIWNRVEEKLDEKKNSRVIPIWQYAGIAAILVICLTVGGYIITNNTSVTAPTALPENEVSTVIDTQKVEEVLNPEKIRIKQEVVVNEPVRTFYSSKSAERDDSKTSPDIKLQESYTELDEVVVDVQMPPVRERYVGAAIAPDNDTIDSLKMHGEGMAMLHNKNMKTIGQGTIEQSPRASFVQNMEGQFPGVKVETGKPPGTTIRIGSNAKGFLEPMYVIDGMIANYSIFKQLDPKKIESVSILKDEGAKAIYTDRGKNGVIIITTKHLSRKEKRQLKKLIKEHAEKSVTLSPESNNEKPK